MGISILARFSVEFSWGTFLLAMVRRYGLVLAVGLVVRNSRVWLPTEFFPGPWSIGWFAVGYGEGVGSSLAG